MTFSEAFNRLKKATCPEDVFGVFGYPVSALSAYRELAKIVHPDKADGHKDANEAFVLLEHWKVQMDRKAAKGAYGDCKPSMDPISIKTKRTSYVLEELIANGDICDVYAAGDAAIKIVRSAANNDLARNETAMIKKVNQACSKLAVAVHVPVLMDSFELGKKRVNVLGNLKGYCTLVELLETYPDGLFLGDAAWIFNRLLGALSAAHSAGVVHGAVLPQHFMVNEDHNGVLLDWSYAVDSGSPMKAIVPGWNFYPPEVLQKRPVDFGADVYMAAECLKYITHGTHPKLDRLLRACQLGAAYRIKSVMDVHKEFGEILVYLFGKRKFRHLAMPTTKTKG